MKILVMGKEYKLNGKDVDASKKMALDYFDKVRKLSVQHIAPKLYWTSIVVMHVVTNELLNSIDSESLAMLLNGDDSSKQNKSETPIKTLKFDLGMKTGRQMRPVFTVY